MSRFVRFSLDHDARMEILVETFVIPINQELQRQSNRCPFV
jgi:hypothetical protein